MSNLKDAIEKVWSQYASSLVAGDLDRWSTLWIDDGIQMPPHAPANIGKEKIRNYLETYPPVLEMAINSEEVREAGNWGFSRGNYWLVMAPKEGETVKLTGKFLTVFEKQDDDSWKIARDIFNIDSP